MQKWILASETLRDINIDQSYDNVIFPPVIPSKDIDMKPIENSSKIIRQMALIGSDNYIVLDENVSDSMKNCHDTEPYNYQNTEGITGDANRVYCTHSDNDELFNLEKSHEASKVLIVGHYEDVKAYANNDKFNKLYNAFIKNHNHAGHVVAQLVGDIVTLHLVSLEINNTIEINSRYMNRTIDNKRLMRKVTLFQDKTVLFNDFETTLQTLLKCYNFINTVLSEDKRPKVINGVKKLLKNPKMVEKLESL